jgi:hypothetical protein
METTPALNAVDDTDDPFYMNVQCDPSATGGLAPMEFSLQPVADGLADFSAYPHDMAMPLEASPSASPNGTLVQECYSHLDTLMHPMVTDSATDGKDADWTFVSLPTSMDSFGPRRSL